MKKNGTRARATTKVNFLYRKEAEEKKIDSDALYMWPYAH